MSDATHDPCALSANELQRLLASGLPLLPELAAARDNLEVLRGAPQAQAVLSPTQHLMDTIEQIPQTSYTLYRLFVRDGDRQRYETPYFRKRTSLAAAALRLFLRGATGSEPLLRDIVQDYLWSICEESSWVLPAHEDYIIDLFAAESGFVLAETLLLLGETLDAEVCHRVRLEIERRIFDPYLRFHRSLGLQDDFRFLGDELEIEEALITWLDVEADGATALVRGERHALRLTIEAPAGARFSLEQLAEQSAANAKPGILKRLSFTLPIATETQARVPMEVVSAM